MVSLCKSQMNDMFALSEVTHPGQQNVSSLLLQRQMKQLHFMFLIIKRNLRKKLNFMSGKTNTLQILKRHYDLEIKSYI